MTIIIDHTVCCNFVDRHYRYRQTTQHDRRLGRGVLLPIVFVSMNMEFWLLDLINTQKHILKLHNLVQHCVVLCVIFSSNKIHFLSQYMMMVDKKNVLLSKVRRSKQEKCPEVVSTRISISIGEQTRCKKDVTLLVKVLYLLIIWLLFAVYLVLCCGVIGPVIKS